MASSPPLARHDADPPGSPDSFHTPVAMSPTSQPASLNQSPRSTSPTIRIVPMMSATLTGINFPIIELRVPNTKIIKVKRFVQKSNSDYKDCITFKSKVVSRQHGEIWTEGRNFYFRDTKSSSGTFINNLRVSPPGVLSQAMLLHDGDVIQLGIDYQDIAGEVFRCVRMSVELNRGAFFTRNNPFRRKVNRVFRALTLANNADSDGVAECCICLCALTPMKALFTAPCCHSFHYKCVRPLLLQFPNFQCPLCRHFADLNASISFDDLASVISSDDDEGEGEEELKGPSIAAGAQLQRGTASSSGSKSSSSQPLLMALPSPPLSQQPSSFPAIHPPQLPPHSSATAYHRASFTTTVLASGISNLRIGSSSNISGSGNSGNPSGNNGSSQKFPLGRSQDPDTAATTAANQLETNSAGDTSFSRQSDQVAEQPKSIGIPSRTSH